MDRICLLSLLKDDDGGDDFVAGLSAFVLAHIQVLFHQCLVWTWAEESSTAGSSYGSGKISPIEALDNLNT